MFYERLRILAVKAVIFVAGALLVYGVLFVLEQLTARAREQDTATSAAHHERDARPVAPLDTRPRAPLPPREMEPIYSHPRQR